MTAMNNLASCYYGLKRLDEAAPLMKEVYELRKSMLGPEHPHTIISMTNLAVVLEGSGNGKEARPYFEESLKISESKNGINHPGTLLRIRNLANCCRDLGDRETALKLYQRYVDRHGIKDCKESLSYANALVYLGFNQLKFEMWAEAEPVLRQCLALREKHLADDDWRVGGAQSLLGATLLKLRKFEEAEPLLISGFEIQKAKESEMLGNAADAIDQALPIDALPLCNHVRKSRREVKTHTYLGKWRWTIGCPETERFVQVWMERSGCISVAVSLTRRF